MGTLLERLRPLVGSNGWDYCVIWRVNEEQRLQLLTGLLPFSSTVELNLLIRVEMDGRVLEGQECCCGAAADVNKLDKQDELLLPVSTNFLCRDVSFHHQKSTCCEFLSQLPSSVPLDDSGYQFLQEYLFLLIT